MTVFPRKRLGSIWSGKETREARQESAERGSPTGRQESSTIHAEDRRLSIHEGRSTHHKLPLTFQLTFRQHDNIVDCTEFEIRIANAANSFPVAKR